MMYQIITVTEDEQMFGSVQGASDQKKTEEKIKVIASLRPGRIRTTTFY